jgi:hypothetical protein
MDNRTVPCGRVELALEDGAHITVRAAIAHRIVGVDAERDPVARLGEPDSPMHHGDGSEYLVPLTPCCNADGKGADVSTGVVCRACYAVVDIKYGSPSELVVHVAGRREAR